MVYMPPESRHFERRKKNHQQMNGRLFFLHRQTFCLTFCLTFLPHSRNPTGGNVRRNLELMNVENYLEEQKVGAHLGSVSAPI